MRNPRGKKCDPFGKLQRDKAKESHVSQNVVCCLPESESLLVIFRPPILSFPGDSQTH